ncbi:class I SAM-dependent methyltransferase [Psychrobacillus sp. AK 1817]|uniref:class I SAM-dependent methyltransferase n=1 Tax=Psychrobacillus sp. AK 1817 TaxID=2303505 RepID=UPI001245E69D|nr:class I SAM-dependent methyltransferase [Psychrobacillus sp. AK 1817]QEY19590.1 class I SAM-dependent methyltransferase [Psychrobacillus sp. AK 1817]
MNIETLKKDWKMEEIESFKGWDFSHLEGRWKEQATPWDYRKIIDKYLSPENVLLDMGTGGGEFLITLGHPFERTSVTEGWEPNVNLCKEKLEPLGICVKQVFNDSELPFEDNVFDIIINRHESYDVNEIRRILKKGGIFITQQVGGKNNEWLSNALINNFQPLYPSLNLENETKRFTSEGFAILYEDEYFPSLKFLDVGAIVYYAKIIEWEFPGFTVDSCLERLIELEKVMQLQGYVESYEHRFILVARKS